MERSSQEAADFIRHLTELAYRLTAKGIVVSTLHADWSHFGCWTLEAQRGTEAERYEESIMTSLRSPNPVEADGPEVVRVLWDGREGILTIEASPTRFLSGPHEWKRECEKGFDKAGDDILRFAEDYLTKRLES
jgi:hypothetical protein